MSRMPLEERREALVAATLAVVERDGIGGATTRAIVTEAGMPLGALHYAFASVDHLLAAAIDAVTDQERIVAEAPLATGTGADLTEVLAAGVEGYVSLLVERPARELAYLELMLHASRQRLDDGPGAGGYERSYDVLAGLLETAAATAGCVWTAPPRALARHAVAMLDGITTTWLADHDTEAAMAGARFLASALAAHATGRPTEED
ncbi:TetR/AcrR family transcriptional regulator [Demequina mangrovi]|uniref:Transcriptional regulator, TetR family n=1 Tax=Demequina mangrovi TaxID=1043493 RepID=A0A1H6U7Y1_9MICO|nr:TetR family transcriptional regulator [Demequina mangrovi]SEI84385.1 transcriptional regulator, TetR family [Demequina mangrovi]